MRALDSLIVTFVLAILTIVFSGLINVAHELIINKFSLVDSMIKGSYGLFNYLIHGTTLLQFTLVFIWIIVFQSINIYSFIVISFISWLLPIIFIDDVSFRLFMPVIDTLFSWQINGGYVILFGAGFAWVFLSVIKSVPNKLLSKEPEE